MSCFWDALIKHICDKDLINLLNNSINPSKLANYLKSNNKIVNTIKINNLELSKKQKTENFEHVKNYNINSINDGYDCSTSDPFLILIADLLSITIINNFNNIYIKYIPVCHSRYTIYLKNTNNHME